MDILLHIGQSKTGTSAIQAYLTLNRERLSEEGILYPMVTIGGMPVDLGNHNALADTLVGLQRFPNLTAQQYFDRFFDEAAQSRAKTMILSGEHFFGGEPRVWDVADEKTYFSVYIDKIKTLAHFLDGHEVTLLVYLRPQVDWLASAISQTIRVERLIRDRAVYRDDRQFFEMSKPLLRYCTLIDAWVDYLHPRDILVVPYERDLLHKGSTVADFLHRAGLDFLDLPFGGVNLQVNRSLSWEYVEVKKKLNHRPKSKAEERAVISCLERLSARKDRIIPYRISEELSQEVESFVALENTRLNARYIQSNAQLKAVGETYDQSEVELLGENAVAEAMAAFKREYANPRTRFLKANYGMRTFLRQHAKPIHSALHQLKRAYRKNVYRK